MSCCNRHLRQTGPTSSHNELVTPAPHSRQNGWSFPPTTSQLVAWFSYGYFVIAVFGILIPLLPSPWNSLAYGLVGATFLLHLVTHIASVSIDPAHPGVREKNYSKPMVTFDKDKHVHVIHDDHCHVCEIDVGPKVKHCRTCNKCVTEFDHHCKWLNNCVGGRNYWVFFVTVLSAVIGLFLLLLIILYVFIEHFVNPAALRTAPQFQSVNESSTWLVFLPLAPVEISSVGLLVLNAFTFLLGLCALILLSYLLAFHVKLLCKKMSTYEHIMLKKQTRSTLDVKAGANKPPPQNEESVKKQAPLEIPMDCESTLPSQTSIFDYEDEKRLGSRLSVSICSEMMGINSSSGVDHIYQSTKSSRHVQPGDLTLKGQQGSEKSVEGTPVVQNPLGSSVMVTTPAKQQLSMDTGSEAALSH